MTKQSYVYELIDPRDGAVFYVGKGKGDRILAHEREAAAGRVSRKCARIRDIWDAGLVVERRKVRSFADEQAAYDFEAALIETRGLHTLTNAKPGGGSPRSGPYLSVDREEVRAFAEFFNRTRNGAITSILVGGKVLDLQPIAEEYARRLASIAARRGAEWVNGIAKTRGVRFSNA